MSKPATMPTSGALTRSGCAPASPEPRPTTFESDIAFTSCSLLTRNRAATRQAFASLYGLFSGEFLLFTIQHIQHVLPCQPPQKECLCLPHHSLDIWLAWLTNQRTREAIEAAGKERCGCAQIEIGPIQTQPHPVLQQDCRLPLCPLREVFDEVLVAGRASTLEHHRHQRSVFPDELEDLDVLLVTRLSVHANRRQITGR